MITAYLEPSPKLPGTLEVMEVNVPDEDTKFAINALSWAKHELAARAKDSQPLPTVSTPGGDSISTTESTQWHVESAIDRLWSDQGHFVSHSFVNTAPEKVKIRDGQRRKRLTLPGSKMATHCLGGLLLGIDAAAEAKVPSVSAGFDRAMHKIPYIGTKMKAAKDALRVRAKEALLSNLDFRVVRIGEAAIIREVRKYEEGRYLTDMLELEEMQFRAWERGQREMELGRLRNGVVELLAKKALAARNIDTTERELGFDDSRPSSMVGPTTWQLRDVATPRR